MAGNFFRGTTTEQDSRWGGDRALMKKMERAEMFSKILEIKVGSLQKARNLKSESAKSSSALQCLLFV